MSFKTPMLTLAAASMALSVFAAPARADDPVSSFFNMFLHDLQSATQGTGSGWTRGSSGQFNDDDDDRGHWSNDDDDDRGSRGRDDDDDDRGGNDDDD